jgi:hypothetical protein
MVTPLQIASTTIQPRAARVWRRIALWSMSPGCGASRGLRPMRPAAGRGVPNLTSALNQSTCGHSADAKARTTRCFWTKRSETGCRALNSHRFLTESSSIALSCPARVTNPPRQYLDRRGDDRPSSVLNGVGPAVLRRYCSEVRAIHGPQGRAPDNEESSPPVSVMERMSDHVATRRAHCDDPEEADPVSRIHGPAAWTRL